MKTLRACLCLGLLSGTVLAQDLSLLVNDYLVAYWKAHPASAATPAGIHTYDKELEDFSPPSLQQEIQRNHDFLARLERFEEKKLTIEDRVDRDMLLDHVRLALLEMEEVRSWKTHPQHYVALLGQAAMALIKRQFAPAPARFAAITERLKQYPRLLKQARANLDNPPELYTRKALELIPDTADFLEKGVPRAAIEQGLGGRVLGRVQKESLAAAAALRGFGRWLQEDLLPRSKGSFVLGADLFRREFRSMGVELTPEQALEAAEADRKATQAEMKRLAAQVQVEGSRGRSLAEVLAFLSQKHPRREELLRAHREAVAEAKSFVSQKRLTPLPQPERLEVETAPPFTAAGEARFDGPGPFESELASFYYVSGLENISDETAEDLLRDSNSYAIPLAGMEEAYPGRYVQWEAMNRNPAVVRKVFPSPAFVEGWAHYAGQMMFEEGFRSDVPGRLFQLKNALRAQLDAILDIRLHTGQISPADGVKMLIEEGYQQRATAEARVEHACLAPTELSRAYVGKLEILRLREELRGQLGAAFILREFHQRLLSLGAPPVRAARQLLR